MPDSPAPSDAYESFDEPWKVALVAYFWEFLELCFPSVYAAVNPAQAPVFLDAELEQITPEKARGSLGVDKLVRLKMKNGSDIFAFIHIEVQAQTMANFPRRMWTYHYRIFDKLKVHPIQLAVLADNNRKWRPGAYQPTHIVPHLTLDYFTFKVMDFNDPEEIFAKTGNIFALILAASVAAHQTRHKAPARLKRLLGLVRAMKERGLELREIFRALRVLQWLLRLPADFELQYRAERVTILQEGTNMKIEDLELIEERLARQEGRMEGKLEGELKNAREAVLEVLEVRFGEVPYLLAERIRHLPSFDALKHLLRRATITESLSTFASELGAES